MEIVIEIPDDDAEDVKDGLARWEDDAKALNDEYDKLSLAEQIATLLAASAKVRTSNLRRERAERAIRVTPPQVRVKPRVQRIT